MRGDKELVLRVVEELPQLRDLYEEHIADYDELLPHVFFGDLVRRVVTLVQSDGCIPPLVERLLEILEEGLASDDYDIKDLVGVSFAENIEEFNDVCELIKSRSGPRLLSAFWTP